MVFLFIFFNYKLCVFLDGEMLVYVKLLIDLFYFYFPVVLLQTFYLKFVFFFSYWSFMFP